MTPKSDENMESWKQSKTDKRRLVVVCIHNSMSYQIEGIVWNKNPETQTFKWA